MDVLIFHAMKLHLLIHLKKKKEQEMHLMQVNNKGT